MNLSNDNLRKAQDVFELALAVPPEQRTALLERECAGDETLLREAASLLQHAGAGMTFWKTALDQNAAEAAAELSHSHEQSWIGRRFGVWKITGILGAGGMGAVYEVHRDDGTYRQRAALKISRREMDTATSGADSWKSGKFLRSSTIPTSLAFWMAARALTASPIW